MERARQARVGEAVRHFATRSRHLSGPPRWLERASLTITHLASSAITTKACVNTCDYAIATGKVVGAHLLNHGCGSWTWPLQRSHAALLIMPSLTFLALPVDIHVLIAEQLQPQDLLPLALASRITKVLYNKPLARRVRLDGAAQLLTFVKRCGEGVEPAFCPSGHPLPRSPNKQQQSESCSRADAVQELELQEPGMLQGPCWELAVLLDQLEGGGGTPGGVLGALIQLCSSLRKLRVLQSSLPFTGALALALTTWTPALSALTFRTKHCDAAALALAVQSLPLLRTLDVSGVKTCGE